ncbi:MAG: rod shape-determining protein MreC [Phycisphaerales bacterium]
MLLPAVVVGLTVLSLSPLWAIRWTAPFGNVTTMLLTPGSALVSMASRWLMPQRRAEGQTDLEKTLFEEVEHYKTLYLRSKEQSERLQRQIEDMQRGQTINSELPVRQVLVPVVGTSSDLSSGLLRVRAGESLGISPESTVAVTGGLQIVGRLTGVSGATALIQPITSKAAGKIAGKLMVDEPNGVGLLCLLEPLGDGRLRGKVESPEGASPTPPPEIGQTVRLSDDRWPASSQMFIVGKVESVEQDAASPLRTVITVAPTVSIERLSEVTLRITTTESTPTGGKR